MFVVTGERRRSPPKGEMFSAVTRTSIQLNHAHLPRAAFR